MCGIAGIYGTGDRALVGRMIAAQGRRGPDGVGLWSDPAVPVALGHARLSIIDTSNAGSQPMTYGEGRFVITFNGEIYNYRELRKELESLGARFASHSDTEVILAAYAQWGRDCVRRLRGMFAFAIVDRRPTEGSPDVFLARDRFGIKPLLYCDNQMGLSFASELRAFTAAGLVARRLNRAALQDYLAFGAVFQPDTILESVRALPSGHWLAVKGKKRELCRYWDLHEATAQARGQLQGISYADAVAELRSRLTKAARYSMVADVQVGAFLSGGIDSTAVVGFMSAAGSGRIKTFSVGFEAQRGLDERRYAQIAARHIGTDHVEVVVGDGEAKSAFEQIVRDIDQPSIDGTNTWLVSRAARSVLKVATSGLGGDELFAGYPHFRRMAGQASVPPSATKRLLVPLARGVHGLRPNRVSEAVLFGAGTTVQRLGMLRRVIDDCRAGRALHSGLIAGFAQRVLEVHDRFMLPDADLVQQVSYSELRGYLQSTLLRDGDVMSMCHGLEVRPMLLDHELAEFTYALPGAIKLEGAAPKQLFIDAAAEYIPDSLRTREKMGFEMPFTDWMAGGLRNTFSDLLAGRAAGAVFSRGYLASLQSALRAGRPPRDLWAYGILLAWMEQVGAEVA